MVSAVNFYLKRQVRFSEGQASPNSLLPAYATAYRSVDSAWAVSMSELKGLLNNRLSNLLGKDHGSLLLNGLVAGLSLLFAAMTYRQIVRRLRQPENSRVTSGRPKTTVCRINLERRGEIGQLANGRSMPCSRSLPQRASVRSLRSRLTMPRCKPNSRELRVSRPWARWRLDRA